MRLWDWIERESPAAHCPSTPRYKLGLGEAAVRIQKSLAVPLHQSGNTGIKQRHKVGGTGRAITGKVSGGPIRKTPVHPARTEKVPKRATPASMTSEEKISPMLQVTYEALLTFSSS